MPDVLKELEREALELSKRGEFGSDAASLNARIVALAPTHEAAWTRLGRCHLELRNYDEAVSAFRAALGLNPTNTIATNLLTEVRRRRALTPTAAQRATTGFSEREFAVLETVSADEACRALAPRIEALLDSINASDTAQKIVAARNRRGASGTRLFHRNSYYPGGSGHIFAFHHGGRWEPQFNLGWFAGPPVSSACVRIGIGFNLSRDGRDPDRDEGQRRAIDFFARFQRVIDGAWKRWLVDWMSASGGFVQHDAQPPALDLLPDRAVDWLIHVDASRLDWVFCGRWLFAERAADAAILGDRAKLARAVDEVFRAMYPVWLAVYDRED